MATVSHRISGLDGLRRRLAALPEAARAAATPALHEVAEGVADEVRAALDGGARVGPSAPGTPPADASGGGGLGPGPAKQVREVSAGRLAGSIAVAAEPGLGRAAVTVSAPYAVFLEYGTARMTARPFLRPAALEAGREAVAVLAAALRRGLKP